MASSMTGKHTPGPWVAVKAGHGPIDIMDPRGRDVVTVYGGVDPGSYSANAALIAAAPELLAALEFCMSEGLFRDPKVERIALAAIAKAKSRVPGPPDGPGIPPQPFG